MKDVKKKSLIVMLLSIIMIILIMKDDFANTFIILKSCNLKYLLFSILVYYIGFTFEVITLNILIKQYKKDYKFKKSFRLNTITKFFNGITPLASGGQPLQVYELKKDGIKVAHGSNIVAENFLLYQISLVLLSIIMILINIIFNIVNIKGIVYILLLIGVLLNTGLLVIAYLVSVNKTLIFRSFRKLVLFLHKFGLIKDTNKIIDSIKESCLEFYNGFICLKKNKKVIISGVLLQIIALLINFSVTLFVVKSLNISDNINLLEILIASLFAFLAGSFIPLPGGTGGMEYAFFSVFSVFIVPTSLKPILLIWRFVTYIMPVIVGAITFNTKK